MIYLSDEYLIRIFCVKFQFILPAQFIWMVVLLNLAVWLVVYIIILMNFLRSLQADKLDGYSDLWISGNVSSVNLNSVLCLSSLMFNS